MAYYQSLASEPELRHNIVRMVGTGASAPTRLLGDGVTITRDGVGVYTLTWASNPGVWVGPAGESFQATTSADVKGCSVSWGAFDSTAYTVQFKVWNSAAAARELAASEWLTVDVMFKATGG